MSLTNLFLSRLPADERELILKFGKYVDQESGHIIVPTGEPITKIYFPDTSVISLVTEMQDGRSVEAATVGREGLVGFQTLWGVPNSSQTAVVQVPGRTFEVPVEQIAAVMDQLPVFSIRLGRYAEALMALMSQSAACLALHPVQERCARWLLMTADRTGNAEFELTQEFLASMLGVHRPTVTIAIGQLEKAGLIEHHRARIRITDTERLADASCECYERVSRLFEAILA